MEKSPQAVMQADGKSEGAEQLQVALVDFVETSQDLVRTHADEEIDTLEQLPQKVARKAGMLGQSARRLTTSVETSQALVREHADEEIETLAQLPRDLAAEIETLGQSARDLATTVETSRLQTLKQSDGEIEALWQKARDLAKTVESSRLRTLKQSDNEIETLGQQARDLATRVESSRLKTLKQSDNEIEVLSQQARDLATTVESSRLQTVKQSNSEIEALGQKARDLAAFVETARLQTLQQSENEIQALRKKARDLATFVESSRLQTLEQADNEVEALGQKARDLATFVETLRMQTQSQSDAKIEALGQKARDLATTVETERIQALDKSNKEIRKLNEGLEQRVVERTAQLEAANKELDAFSYSVSHDLRAPLRAIDGFSRILIEDYGGSLAEEAKAYLQKVRDNTKQMGALVDDLLAFARLGRQPLAKHVVETDKIVRRCLEEMKKEQQERQVEVVIGELPTCHADPALLKQVWTNLIDNAFKYTRKQEKPRIEIGCRTQPRLVADGEASNSSGPEMVYFIKDNGAGFDMKYVRKLFGVFQRLHRAADYEGTGVGLANVQRIVQRHGGRIWGEAVLNEGATFSFTLD